MRKLTLREKVLIYMAVVLALLAAGFYVSQMPDNSAEAKLRAELMAITLELEQQKQLTGKTEEMEIEKLRLQADIEKKFSGYPVYRKSNAAMIADLTELLTACGMMPEQVEVEKPDSLIDLTGMAEIDEVNSSDCEWHVLVAHIDVITVGTMEHICRLLDMIESKPWISVPSFESDHMDGLRMTLTYSMLVLSDAEIKQ